MELDFLEKLRDIDFRRALSVQLEIRPTLRAVPYWVAGVIVGLTAVIYSLCFGTCINFSQSLARHHPFILLGFSPLCFAIATWLCEHFAPPAAGTGVPAVNRALQMDFGSQAGEIDRLINLRVMIIIMLSSLVCILGGGAMGREGPMVHISACLFYFTGRQFHKFWPYQEHRSWLIAGGAAGVAAAFNAPLAGIVFVLEELAEQHFHQFKTTVISAVIVAGMVAQWLSGRYLFLGYPRIEYVSLSSVPIALLVGLVCGLGASFFEKIIAFLKAKWDDYRLAHKLLFAALMGVLTALLAGFVDSRTAGGGIGTIQDLLFTDGERATWKLIAVRFFGPILGHLSGSAGGFLAPALALGAVVGSKVAMVVDPSQHNLLVMIGMAGFLSAFIRAPFTALVIVMEMTDRHSTIFPLMITSLVSFAVVRRMAGRTRA